MQKYLILINVEAKVTGFVRVPECFTPSDEFKATAERYGYAALTGICAFDPSDSELRNGRLVLDALLALHKVTV